MTDFPKLEPKMEPKEASHWVAQSLKLFPQGTSLTPEMVTALVSLVCQYPRNVAIRALGEAPIKYKFMPSLSEFKTDLDGISAQPSQEAQRQARLAQQIREREMYKPKAKPREWFTGPIENIRPGDLLSPARIEEYNAYMRKTHGITPKHWTFLEEWKDNGQRPFAINPTKTEDKGSDG